MLRKITRSAGALFAGICLLGACGAAAGPNLATIVLSVLAALGDPAVGSGAACTPLDGAGPMHASSGAHHAHHAQADTRPVAAQTTVTERRSRAGVGLAWSSPQTWQGAPPAAGERVLIPAGSAVILDQNTPDLEGLTIEGELRFANQALHLTADWIYVGDGGLFQIGAAAAPYAHKAILTLNAPDPASCGPHDMGVRGLLVMGGALRLYGAAPATAWTKLNAHASAGATTLQLASAVNWQPGDEIVVAPTDFYGVATAERHSLAAVAGNNLTLASGLGAPRWGVLQYPQNSGVGLSPDAGYAPPSDPAAPGASAPTVIDQRAEVGLLTRHIVIESPDDALWREQGFGVHTMIMGPTSSSVISGVQFRRAGQRGRTGRYPVHYHVKSYDLQTGAQLADATDVIENSTVQESSNRGIVIHATNGVRVDHNILFDISGHGFFLEDNVERRNLLEDNLCLRVRNPAQPLKLHEADGFQVGSSCYWITNPDNILRRNVAADVQGPGFWLSFAQNTVGISARVPLRPQSMTFGVFDDNTAHSINKPCLNLDWVQVDEAGAVAPLQYQPRPNPNQQVGYGNMYNSTFRRFTGYKCREECIWNRVAGPIYEEFVCADNQKTFFAGSSGGGRITRALVVRESLNNATAASGDTAALKSYHSGVDMDHNTFINFSYEADRDEFCGALNTNDYYLRPVDLGFVRNPGNQLINSNFGCRVAPPAHGRSTLAGALHDPHGSIGPAGGYWTYDAPFFTYGTGFPACSQVQPAGANGRSCTGPYFGVLEFVLNQGNDRFDARMPIEARRLDETFNDVNARTIIGTWSVLQGLPEFQLPNMRHFAARQGGRYELLFPGVGPGAITDVGLTLENMQTIGDWFVLGVAYSGATAARVYTTGYENYFSYAQTPNGPSKRNFVEVADFAALIAHAGDAYWQDHVNQRVWMKIRGGMTDPFVVNADPLGDELLYKPLYLRIHPE